MKLEKQRKYIVAIPALADNGVFLFFYFPFADPKIEALESSNGYKKSLKWGGFVPRDCHFVFLRLPAAYAEGRT
jgi:hypothetical protein